MVRAEWRPPCIATSATPGRWFERRHVADGEHLGVPGKREVGEDRDPTRLGRRRLRSPRPSIAASGEAWTPAAQTTVRAADALVAVAGLDVDTRQVDVR